MKRVPNVTLREFYPYLRLPLVLTADFGPEIPNGPVPWDFNLILILLLQWLSRRKKVIPPQRETI